MPNPKAPSAAHHALITDLHQLGDRYVTMPAAERVAVIAQFLGSQIAGVEGHSPAEVMHAVSLNIAAGNRQAAGSLVVANEVGHG